MYDLRKITVLIDEVHTEAGHADGEPVRRVLIMAAVRNPFAGTFTKDLQPLIDIGGEVGELMSERLLAQFDNDPASIESYGKAAIVGENGEKEHAAAVMHPTMGKPLRAAVGPAPSIIPSAKKIGGPGTTIDCPLHHKEDVWTFSHFDAMEVSLADAPRADEIVVIIAITDSGRPLHRVGEGVSAADVMSD